MTMIHLCISCQYGHHEDHQEWPKRPIEGLIGGGWQCPCEGECIERQPSGTLKKVMDTVYDAYSHND